jgi:hypothetical protein
MDDKKDCKISACCKTHWCTALGMIFLVVAVVLTITTYSSLGIFGMFLAGIMLCCHKHMSARRCGCGCGCACCASCDESVCDTPKKAQAVGVKKAATKKA